MDNTVIVALIGAAVTIGNVVFTTLANRKAAKSKEEKALVDGLQCLLRAEIIRSHDKYTSRKYCPIYAREAVSRAYDAYHALGGNGTITELYRQLITLPTEPPGEHTDNG